MKPTGVRSAVSSVGLYIVSSYRSRQASGKEGLSTPGCPGLLTEPGLLQSVWLLEEATHTSPKQNNFCASKEDAILGAPNKKAAGVSGTALPEHSQHSGQPCLESKIT